MKRVLLVDDEPFILQGLKAVIDWNAEGFEVVRSCANGLEAYNYLKESQVDVILADIKMPEMTGIELLRRIREEKISDAFFIVLTGFKDFTYIQTALRYDCMEYMLKPVEKTELISVLRRIARAMGEETFDDSIFAEGAEKEPEAFRGRKSTYYVNDEDTEGPDEIEITNNSGLLLAVEKEIRENYATNITLRDLGKKFFVNSAYLGQLFQKKYGQSFKDYLTEYRIERAQELLTTTDMRIAEISEKIGYKDSDYFLKKFIEANGVTPSKYRKMNT